MQMRDRDLDKILMDKLNQIAITQAEGAWAAFERRYDSEKDFETLAEEIHFDNQVSEKSKHIKSSTSSHWPLLQNDLAIIDKRRMAVWHYKAMETLLVCFMIYATSLVPHEMLFKEISPTPKKIHNPYEYASANKKTSTKPFTGSNYRNNVNLPNNKVHSEISIVGFLTETDNLPQYVDENVVVASTNNIAHSNNVGMLNDEIRHKNEVDDLQSDILKSGASNPMESASIQSVLTQDNSNVVDANFVPTTSDAIENYPVLKEIVSSSATVNEGPNHEKSPVAELTGQVSRQETNLNIDLLPFITPNPASEYALSFPIAFVEIKPVDRYVLSLWASRDINMINTPFDKIYSIASYQKEALNYSFGANISRKRGKIDVSTGVEYAKRTYQPKPFTEKYGTADTYYFESSLNKISYDIVSVPLKIKYDFLSNNKWNAYLMAGAALSMIVDAKYEIWEEIIHESPSDFSLSQSNSPRLESKNFIKGIGNFDSNISTLENKNGIFSSSFNDNYFASLTFGIGIEKKLSPLSSIYIEPSYQRHVLSSDIGIGPNKDKIHTSSLQLGFRTMLL